MPVRGFSSGKLLEQQELSREKSERPPEELQAGV